MSSRALVVLLTVVALFSGCGSFLTKPDEQRIESVRAARVDLLERQARTREGQVEGLQAEVTALEAERAELRRLLQEAGGAVKTVEEGGKPPAERPLSFEATRVGFSFLTCAIDTDGKKGDDAVAAYVNIYDQFDSSVKVAGGFRFELFDLARPVGHMIQSWSFTPEAAALYWGRFPACYQFKLPLSNEVHTKKAILKVTFSREGKKDLMATREVKIELP